MRNSRLKKIILTIDNHIDLLRKSYNVETIGVFGSLVRNQQTNRSDIDIIVDFYKPIGFFKFLELEDFLSKILMRKVDLVSKKALKPVIKKEVLKEVIYV